MRDTSGSHSICKTATLVGKEVSICVVITLDKYDLYHIKQAHTKLDLDAFLYVVCELKMVICRNNVVCSVV